jgi:hypothetical protein
VRAIKRPNGLVQRGRDDPFANAFEIGAVKSQHRNLPTGNAGK